jgi:hypothetical protein
MAGMIRWSYGVLTRMAGSDLPLHFMAGLFHEALVGADLWELLSLRARRRGTPGVAIPSAGMTMGLSEIVAPVLRHLLFRVGQPPGCIAVGSAFAAEFEALRLLDSTLPLVDGGIGTVRYVTTCGDREVRLLADILHRHVEVDPIPGWRAVEVEPAAAVGMALDQGLVLYLNMLKRIDLVEPCIGALLSDRAHPDAQALLCLRVDPGEGFPALSMALVAGMVPGFSGLLDDLRAAGWIVGYRSLGSVDLDFLLDKPQHDGVLLALHRGSGEIPPGFIAVSDTPATTRAVAPFRGRDVGGNLDLQLAASIAITSTLSNDAWLAEIAARADRDDWDPAACDWSAPIADFADALVVSPLADSAAAGAALIEAAGQDHTGIYARIEQVRRLAAAGQGDLARDLAIKGLSEATTVPGRMRLFLERFAQVFGRSFVDAVGSDTLRQNMMALLLPIRDADDHVLMRRICAGLPLDD